MFRNLEAEQHRLGLTNQDTADYLGITRQAYEYKKKTGKFKREEIVSLLELFKVNFEYLFETQDTQHVGEERL